MTKLENTIRRMLDSELVRHVLDTEETAAVSSLKQGWVVCFV